MTRRRWIADEVSGTHAALVGDHARHLARVLRARIGQQFAISTGENTRNGRVVSITDDRVEFELGEEVETPAIPCITLVMAIFKFDRMEWAIEKCTELGVAGIVPIVARRTDRHLAEAAVKRTDRWKRIAGQASEQSRRIPPPAIDPPLKLEDVLTLPAATRVLLAETEHKQSLKQTLNSHSPGGDLSLAIGPEGGWTEDEQLLFVQAGWALASLGTTILRAETAAVAATAIAIAELS